MTLRQRSAFAILVLVLLGSCGLKVPLPESQRNAGGTESVEGGSTTGDGTEVLGERIDATPGPSGATVTGGSGSSGGSSGGTGAGSTGGASTGGGATGGGSTGGGSTGGPSLFANDTQGLTANSITICTHAPITGAAPIQRDPKQLDVYWDYVNDRGGINGRKVTSIVEDDRYTPDGAIAVAERCKSKAFLMVGPAGVDQITAVSDWAKRNKMPYMHGSASLRSIGDNAYQFFLAPDYEFQHSLLADYIVKVLKKTKVAQIRLDSPHFAAGASVFKARLAQYGVPLMADVTVTGKEQSFAHIAGRLQGAEVVNDFTNPLTWINIVSQLGFQLKPVWVAVNPVAGQNLLIGTLGGILGNGGAHVFYGTPVFRDDPSLPHFAEIDTFLKAFVKSTGKPRSAADDIDWLSWIVNRQLGDMLRASGPGLTRSKLVATAAAYKQSAAQAAPACPLDFTRDAAKRRGAWSVNVFQSSPGKWVQSTTCAGGF